MADSRVTVDHVPEEIWLLIFGKLDPPDMLSCYHTTPKWQNWLKPKRTQFLFHKVAPLILPQLPQSDVLQLRETCAVWKEVVDHASQTHPSHTLFDAAEGPFTSKFDNRFTCSGDIQRFLQDMESHPENPFPGRNLAIGFYSVEYLSLTLNDLRRIYSEFWNNVNLLLDRFGKHVHFASIQLLGLGYLDSGPMFRNCLLRLPSLKRLDFDTRFINNVRLECLRENPLPRLVNLETLKIRNGRIEQIVAILESCCVPQTIKRIFLCDSIDVERLPQVVYNFRNLEVLDCWLSLQDLERLAQARPLLKKMKLRVYNLGSRVVSLERLFRSLESFGETLAEVHTKLAWAYHSHQPGLQNEFRIELPNLTKLTVEDYEGSLDHFLQLSSLSELELGFDQCVDKRPMEGNIVQLRGFEHRMKDSNIWSLLPALKTLTIIGLRSWNRE